jgi:hypothetical protein
MTVFRIAPIQALSSLGEKKFQQDPASGTILWPEAKTMAFSPESKQNMTNAQNECESMPSPSSLHLLSNRELELCPQPRVR